MPTLLEILSARAGYGRLSGRPIAEVNAVWGSVDSAPGAKAWESVLARARSAQAKGAARATDAPVILVSHDAVNSVLLASLDPNRRPSPRAVPQPTGCLNILQRDGGMWTPTIVGMRPRRPTKGA